MAKHASPSAHLQVVESPKSVAVQIPLPVLGALVDGKSALFDPRDGSASSRERGRRDEIATRVLPRIWSSATSEHRVLTSCGWRTSRTCRHGRVRQCRDYPRVGAAIGAERRVWVPQSPRQHDRPVPAADPGLRCLHLLTAAAHVPDPTLTQGVYRSQRSTRYEDGVFIRATEWAPPVLRRGPIDVTTTPFTGYMRASSTPATPSSSTENSPSGWLSSDSRRDHVARRLQAGGDAHLSRLRVPVGRVGGYARAGADWTSPSDRPDWTLCVGECHDG